MKFKAMTTHELAQMLLRGDDVPVLIEDQDAALVAHDRINICSVAHSTKGKCISLSALSTADRSRKNFKYLGEGV